MYPCPTSRRAVTVVSLATRVERAVEIARESGLRVLWIKVLGELGYRRAILIERGLDASVPDATARVPVTVSLLREAEVDEYLALRPDSDPVAIRRRLRDGERCFAVRCDGRLVSVAWVATGSVWIEYLGRYMPLAAEEAFAYEAFTAPAYRGYNVGGPRAVEETRVLRAAGCRRLLAIVSPEDPSARRQAAKLGWQPCGMIGYVKLGPWRHDFSKRWPVTSEKNAAPAYWRSATETVVGQPHYLDRFLGDLKRRAYVELIARWGGVPPAGRVLKTDLFEEAMGTSDAFVTDLCTSKNLVVGMDVAAHIPARARERHGTPVQYVACDVRELPFRSSVFGLIVSPSTLDHFPNPSDLQRSLRELARILTPDGRLIITLDNRQNIFDPLLRLAIWLGWAPYYIGQSYRVDGLCRELDAAGFTVEDTTAIVHHPRMTAVAAVAISRRLGWATLPRFVQRVLTEAQRLERSRWRYYTGCFVAAKAVRRTGPPAAAPGAIRCRLPSEAMASWLTRAYWNSFTLWHARDEERLPYRSTDELLTIQNRRLQAMIAHAYDTVPYYREVMDAAGSQPRDFNTAADLQRLPVLSGEQVAAAPDRFLSLRYTERNGLEIHSSGTQGKPKPIRHDAASLFLALAHGHRERVVLARFVGRKFGYREMSVVRSSSVSLQLRRFYAAQSWMPRHLDFQRDVLPADEPFDAAVERINRFQPDVVRGYGSHLGSLFRWAWERRRPLSGPKVVLYGADPMPDADRSVIEDRLGIPVLSSYQAVEALRLGFQCEQRQGFHLDIDQVAVWVRGEDGKPVEPGERGDLILSNLTNHATVLLNYRLGDVVSSGQRPCPCGRNLPTVDRIEGRCDDAVLLPDGQTRHSLVVLRPLFRVPGLVQVQVIQEELRRFRLRVVCADGTDWQLAQQQLHVAMHAMLGPDIVVESERFDAIPPEPSGKVRAVVSRCRTST